MNETTRVLGDVRIQLHDNEIIPPTLELPLHGAKLGARQALLPDRSGKRRLTFDESEPRGGSTIIPFENLLDEVAPLLIEEHLQERARIEVDRQSRSSLT